MTAGMATEGIVDDPELAALLREQAEFLRSGKAAAAKVVRKAPPSGFSRPNASRPPMHGAKDMIDMGGLPVLNPDAVATPPPRDVASDDPTRLLDEHEARSGSLPAVLADIAEREVVVGSMRPPVAPRRTAFPRALHRDKMSGMARAQLSAKNDRSEWRCGGKSGGGPSSSTAPAPLSGAGTNNNTCGAAPDTTGTGLQREIHKENMTKLRGMSEADIRKEQEQLLRTLDPALVEKLRRQQPVPV